MVLISKAWGFKIPAYGHIVHGFVEVGIFLVVIQLIVMAFTYIFSLFL